MSKKPIDLHLHGYAGLDAQSPDPEELWRLSARLGREGLAGFLLTYVSAPKASILRSLHAARVAAGREKGAKILGIHLEGPFLNPARAGAHQRRFLRKPSLAETKEWLVAAGGLLKIVTLAPELPGSGPVIRFLVRHGVRAQMGHSNATAAQARRAKQLGATGVTHLFNAMGSELADFALKDRTLYTELIADGVHVSDQLLAYTLKTRPLNRIILVSDSCSASGFPCGHRARFAGGMVVTAPDGSLRRSDGTLAASGLSLPRMIRRRQPLWRLAGIASGRLGCLNPSSYLNLFF